MIAETAIDEEWRDREWQVFVHAELNALVRPIVDCHRDRRDRLARALDTHPEPEDEARLWKAYGKKFDEYRDDLILVLQTLCPVDLKYPN